MRQVALGSETDWEGWRRATRSLVLAGVEPAELRWAVNQPGDPLPNGEGTFNVPRSLVALASVAIQARDPDRFALLYGLVWRAQAAGHPLDEATDPDFRLARRLALDVRADAHRMRTHLRFLDSNGHRVGWYEPMHYVLEANAQLLVRRFPHLPFSILTPDGSSHWDTGTLRFGPGVRQITDDEALSAWWDAHGAASRAEAHGGTSIPMAEELDEAPRAPDRPPIGPVVLNAPPDPRLAEAARDAHACARCGLHGPATQTVFGEGPAGASLMFVGEQPGDQEDVIGRPFVGPAGQMLDRAMEEAGIDRRSIYITNAVKHFKFSPRGKWRIHQPPSVDEIAICRFWLDVERVQTRPKLLVLLGGSSARAVLGRPVAVTRERGRPFHLEDGTAAFLTVHPSYLLRIPDGDAKVREYQAFVRDLVTVRELLPTL